MVLRQADRSWRGVYRPGVGAESLSRVRIEIKHMAAAIEPKLGPILAIGRRQMVEYIARHCIGRNHVAVTVSNHEPERWCKGKQHAQIFRDARLRKTRSIAPFPFAGNVGGEQG